MATGKKAKDIFTKTTGQKPKIGLDVAPRIKGRPKTEPYQKVTVCLFDRQTLWLDKVALLIREKTGEYVARAELVRAIVDHAGTWIDPSKRDFDKAIRDLLPSLRG
jgi:hypothetical protein